MPAADIKGLHHTAYRCKDVEETRQFYEDFLGLPLVDAFEIKYASPLPRRSSQPAVVQQPYLLTPRAVTPPPPPPPMPPV